MKFVFKSLADKEELVKLISDAWWRWRDQPDIQSWCQKVLVKLGVWRDAHE